MRRLSGLIKLLSFFEYLSSSFKMGLVMKRLSMFIFALTFALITTGCASLKQVFKGHEYAMEPIHKNIAIKNYDAAIAAIEKDFPEDGKDRLVRYLELGIVAQLQGQYQLSNQHFSAAEQLVDDFFTKSVADEAKAALISEIAKDYRGYVFEYTFIHYYKAMNYLAIAMQEENVDKRKLDDALVEVRRLNNRLSALASEEGSYDDLEEKKDTLLYKVKLLFSNLLSPKKSADELTYRDDAFAHYISGMLFEMRGNRNDAAVSYMKAANLYSKGYSEQYGLGQAIVSQAWFDAARLSKLNGGSKWRSISQNLLDENQRKALNSINTKQPELLVVEYLDFVPGRSILELHMSLDSVNQTLVVRPNYSPFVNALERQYQREWFTMMYGDSSPAGMLMSFSSGGLSKVMNGLDTKSFPLPGPIWETFSDLGLPQAIGSGMRVTVPYYRPFTAPFEESILSVNGTASGPLMVAESISQLALYEQYKSSGNDLTKAVVSNVLKSLTANTAGSSDPTGGFLKAGLQVFNFASASADTRNWLGLPYEIRIKRIPLKVGENRITLETHLRNSPKVVTQSKTFTAKSGDKLIWNVRSFPEYADLPTTAPGTVNSGNVAAAQ